VCVFFSFFGVGVEEMIAGTELVKLSSQQPLVVQENIQELLKQGATESEVLKLLKDALQNAKEAKTT
jgi:hypothetical protein